MMEKGMPIGLQQSPEGKGGGRGDRDGRSKSSRKSENQFKIHNAMSFIKRTL